MAITYVDYTATASQTDFLFNFPYLEDEHVKVEIDGVATTAFTIVTSPSKKIVLDTGATAGEIVQVQRISAPADDLVDFQNGSVLTEAELDRAYLHNRYLAEESAEQNDISLRVKAGPDGSFDALNKKIVNVVDPTADQDAATKNYVDDTVAGIVGGTIPDGSVTYSKIQNLVGDNVLLGNDNGADSDVQELTATEARTLLNVADGAEVNVQSNWNEADTNSDAFILNKPTIPTPTDPVPTGTVSAFAGSTAPAGYVLCDGGEYDETTEASLFAVLSTTYNTGGETANHFRVPDLQGRVIAGMGGSLLSGTDAVADTGGVKEHTLTIDQIPSHTHDGTTQSGLGLSGTGSGRLTNDAGNSTGATGGGLAHPNVQPTIILNYIIKT